MKEIYMSKKGILTLFLSVLLISTAFAQKPEAIALKTETKPVLDGVMDEGVWDVANKYDLVLPFTGETPTLGEPGETNYRILWDDDGIFVFITVTDDVFVPNFSNTGAGYKYDFPEITFDVNYILEDGLGPQENQGHYQIDDHILEADVDGTPKTNTGPIDFETVAFLVDDPNYTAEYFIPFSMLKTKEGGLLDKTQEIGFDVYISDNDNLADLNDPIRNRVVWANQGEITETWDNMDNSGILILDGAEGAIFVEEITLSVDGAITEDGQTLQVMSEILPLDAEDKNLKWILTRADGSAPSASISAAGLITPVMNEELVVQATSSDGFVYSNEITVSISGQILTLDKINYIKNGFFNDVDSMGVPEIWRGWGNGIPMVVDGVLEYSQPETASSIYGNAIAQWIDIPYARKDENFILSFKAWADADRTCQLKIEDQANGWATFGICSAPETDGTSFWPAAQMGITTVPTVYTFELTWANMKENKNIQFNFQLGDDLTKVYMDSVMIVAKADMALLPTAISQEQSVEQFRVYPNPASSKLNVELSSANLSVAIYNSVGVKMDEVVVFGTRHTFDISRYTQGMYFVKAGGAVVKFVK